LCDDDIAQLGHAEHTEQVNHNANTGLTIGDKKIG
jgi:hypothetical protein